MSRIRIAVLFATVAALAAVFVACGGGGGSDEDPQSVIDNATLAGVESGTIDLQLGIKSTGDEGGDIKASLSGPFQAGEKGELPQLAFDVKANGEAGSESIDFEGGLTLLSDRAFVAYKGTEYEVDPTTFGFVKSAFEQAQQTGGSGEAGESTGCQEAAADLEVGQFVDNLTNEGSADVDGTDTTKVSGDLNVDGALDAIIELTKDPACSSQLEAAGDLPLDELEAARTEVSGAVKKAHADVYVGDDDIVRKLGAELTVEPKGSDEKVEIEFELTLGDVNGQQKISAPANAKPLEGLFQELGINPLELLEAGSSGDLGGLLEGLTGGDEGGSSEGSGGGSSQQEYVECLQEAETPTDLQTCANLLQ
ncbi:MAG TPA: hypothetical protein VFJ57_16035 [Solirubrobacterales bacterium]|nr:hypothetical protein [Solirubrobacterales bacterium]